MLHRALLTLTLALAGPLPAPAADTGLPDPGAEPLARSGDVRMYAVPLAPRAGDREAGFTRLEGAALGLERANDYTLRDLYTPFWNGRGLASGDVDRDGWPDVVAAGDHGVVLYLNQQGRGFSARAVEIPELQRRAVFVVALADLDDDGWLDLFTTSWAEGNLVVRNEGGAFLPTGVRATPRGTQNLSKAVAFGDIDRDGDLDAVVGNWYAGWEMQFPPPRAGNVIYTSVDGGFEQTPMDELVGETLSVLLSDFTGDDRLDLIVGNDFGPPDHYYTGDGAGGFTPITRADGRVPVTTFSTMSIDTGDVDGDLDLDVYLTQIAARATGPSADIAAGGQPWARYCDPIAPGPGRERCRENIDNGRLIFRFLSRFRPALAQSCRRIEDPDRRVQCISLMVLLTADRERSPALCERIPDAEARIRQMCRDHFVSVPPPDRAALERAIPQRMNENMLLLAGGDGRFVEQAKERGVAFSGWSWTGRFLDLDCDGWQDFFVVAGTMARDVRAGTVGNSFFHSQGGKRFTEAADAWGLQNHMVVSAYTALDHDRDGDLDLITNSVNGPLWVHRNDGTRGGAVSFELRDARANRYCVGCKLTIHHGPQGARGQLRELKLGGGYLSYDEPVLHFGLGDDREIARIEVTWSTGEQTRLAGPFPAGMRYRIVRGEL